MTQIVEFVKAQIELRNLITISSFPVRIYSIYAIGWIEKLQFYDCGMPICKVDEWLANQRKSTKLEKTLLA